RTDARPSLVALGREADALASSPPLLLRLQDLLLERRGTLDLAEAAEALGRPSRTLQRQLKLSDTSFHAERERARLQLARSLLERGELKVIAVAFEVGFRSPAHFSRWFKRHTGLTPAELRARASTSDA
ncbi:MAG: helix-turn-helix transcriptional regulator, partial [Sandaracinaceae bacterium]